MLLVSLILIKRILVYVFGLVWWGELCEQLKILIKYTNYDFKKGGGRIRM